MDFRGETKENVIDMSTPMDSTRNIGSYGDAALARFFARPVRIAMTGTSAGIWLQGSNMNWALDPWAGFFGDARVINRLTHYHLMKCTLCVKFVLNGNPFLYGQLMASYMPYPAFTGNASTTLDGRSPMGTGIPQELILSSQRPKVFLTPMMSTGACMRIPFFYPGNMLGVETGDWLGLGQINISTMNQLKHANAGTESVTVSAFVWAEDIDMSIPTSYPAYGLVSQAGPEKMDEYSGKISAPATALSNALGMARNLPVVGPYAMATSAAVGAVARISNILGYSRPLELATPTRMTNDPMSNIAATDSTDTSHKLTVDSKQEVSLDTRVMGLDGKDGLGILEMAKVESYLTTFTWVVGAPADTIVFSIPVTPMVYAHWNSSATTIVPTAIAAAVAPFKFWKGTIIYRFQVVCTQYHKGRLRVLYDPFSQQGVNKFNVNYTKIVDLSEDTEFELAVSWASRQLVLPVEAPNMASSSEQWSISAIITPDTSTQNGVITFAVFNQLTAPNDAINNDVSVNVFVRAGEDFEVFVPTSNILDSICLVPQAQWESFDNSDDYLSIGSPEESADLAKVIMGERYVSFRALMKRYVRYCASYSSPGAGLPTTSQTFRNFPLTPGSDASGIHSSTGLAKSVNFVSMTLIAYLSGMFAGYRGSVRYKHVLSGTSNTLISGVVSRDYADGVSSAPTTVLQPLNFSALAFGSLYDKSYGGQAIAFMNLKPVVEVELPYYSQSRFKLTRPLRTNATNGECHKIVMEYPVSSTRVVQTWVSIGEDFTFGFFTGANLWFKNYLVA